MKNKRNVFYRLIIMLMAGVIYFPSDKKIIQTLFLVVFFIAGIFNVSYGQAKVDKLDKLRIYAKYGKFNGSVPVAFHQPS